MPGLKLNKRQGIDNINEMMDMRKNIDLREMTDREQNVTEEKVNTITQNEKQLENMKSGASDTIKRSALYEKHREGNGGTLRRKYDAGKPPRAHMELYREIVAALDGKKRDIVLLRPILQKLEMSYSTSLKIFSLLEEYGYLYFERAQNMRGKRLIIEALRYI